MTTDPGEMLEQVSSPEQLVHFIGALRNNLLEAPENWESLTLPDYLEAMSAWLHDANKNQGSIAHAAVSDGPSWRTFAQILLAASAYE
jgi:hypothetical protein